MISIVLLVAIARDVSGRVVAGVLLLGGSFEFSRRNWQLHRSAQYRVVSLLGMQLVRRHLSGLTSTGRHGPSAEGLELQCVRRDACRLVGTIPTFRRIPTGPLVGSSMVA